MTRRFSIPAAAAAIVLAAVATAADAPKTLGGAAPGLWDLTGIQGSKTPVRECVSKLSVLGHYEHRARTCTATTLSDTGTVAVINYTCGARNFGRTSVKFVTPRILKVETQGISDGMPFGYTIDARRVGECKPAAGGSERGS